MERRYTWVLAYVLTIGCVLSTVHWGDRAVTVVAENIPVPRSSCILIDAGHGGEDGGATSCTGRAESEYNLEISRRLRDLLGLLGYSARMTRDTPDALSTEGETIAQRKLSDLKNRAAMVNREENPILISIHQNKFSEQKYTGAQVFYGGNPGSETLAQMLQQKIVSTLNPGSRRQIKRSSGIYLMENIHCPAVLLECGFLSNPQEEALLSSPDYQKKLCCVIGSSVDQFLRNA